MSERRLRLTTKIPAAVDGTALLDFLAGRFRYHDRVGWEARIARGDVRVDDAIVSPWLRLRRGVVVSYEAAHREPPVPTTIPVVFESPTLLVVDKPAGLPVHADGAFIENTLIAILRARLAIWLQPVHRLDRETSGVLILGKEKATATDLQQRFQRGEVRKTYVALVRGVMAADALTLTAPIGRAPESCITLRRAALLPDAVGAQSARTDVRVLRRGRTRTLLEVTPHSGRTHQIRAHLEGAGHSLVGDVLYGRDDDDYLAWVQHVKAGGEAAWPVGRDAPRHMLHAASVVLPAIEGVTRSFEAPMPPDMLAFLDA